MSPSFKQNQQQITTEKQPAFDANQNHNAQPVLSPPKQLSKPIAFVKATEPDSPPKHQNDMDKQAQSNDHQEPTQHQPVIQNPNNTNLPQQQQQQNHSTIESSPQEPKPLLLSLDTTDAHQQPQEEQSGQHQQNSTDANINNMSNISMAQKNDNINNSTMPQQNNNELQADYDQSDSDSDDSEDENLFDMNGIQTSTEPILETENNNANPKSPSNNSVKSVDTMDTRAIGDLCNNLLSFEQPETDKNQPTQQLVTATNNITLIPSQSQSQLQPLNQNENPNKTDINTTTTNNMQQQEESSSDDSEDENLFDDNNARIDASSNARMDALNNTSNNATTNIGSVAPLSLMGDTNTMNTSSGFLQIQETPHMGPIKPKYDSPFANKTAPRIPQQQQSRSRHILNTKSRSKSQKQTRQAPLSNSTRSKQKRNNTKQREQQNNTNKNGNGKENMMPPPPPLSTASIPVNSSKHKLVETDTRFTAMLNIDDDLDDDMNYGNAVKMDAPKQLNSAKKSVNVSINKEKPQPLAFGLEDDESSEDDSEDEYLFTPEDVRGDNNTNPENNNNAISADTNSKRSHKSNNTNNSHNSNLPNLSKLGATNFGHVPKGSTIQNN